jgi:CubicO group peptidase (beta-lactamase class C family)
VIAQARRGLALALLAVVAGVAPARAAGPIPAERLAEIERYVRAEAAAAHVTSYAFALVTRGAGVVLAEGVGEAEPGGAPMRPDTPLEIGSLSKSITALAAMILVERGALDLDAPVQRYLPSFRVADADATSRITVRHLLNQTSGLGSSAGCYGADTRPAEERLRALATASVLPPGARTQYCNANYEVLALVLEAASGKRYGELVERSVFEPVGMRHAYVDLADATEKGLAWGHRDWFGVSLASRGFAPATIPAAGGLSASAADMGRWLTLHLGGGTIDGRRVSSEQGVAELLTPPEGKRYGMGWRVKRVGQLDARIHDGSTSVFTSSMMIAPSEGVGVVVLTSTNGVPLPYAELHAHDLAEGALLMLAGEPPKGRTTTERWGLRATKWGALAVVLASLAHLAIRSRGRPAWSWRKAAVFTATDLAIVWAMLAGVPSLPDVPLSSVLYYVPDLGLALVLAALLAALRIALRFALRRARRYGTGSE